MFQKGFTVIELLTALVVFSLVVSFTSMIFISVVGHQREILAKQEIVSQVNYATEYMSRALRMAKKELNCTDSSDPNSCSCLKEKGYGYNYEIPSEYQIGDESMGRGIRFINHLQDDKCQKFFLEQGQLKHRRDGSETVPLTSDKFEITNLKFKLFGESQEDDIQPKVAIVLKIKLKGDEEQPKLKIQTTISQRNLDIEL